MAPLGAILRGLARRLLGPDAAVPATDWPRKLARGLHRYEPNQGSGPLPTVILLHGCGGDFRHLESWGRWLASRGLLVFTIDSLTPRGLGRLAALGLVCTGLLLRGRDRSRDITTILPFVLADPKVDRERLHLVGWSHGAWTIAEWMLDASAQRSAESAGAQVASLVLIYPYCGMASSVHRAPWTSHAPLLVVTCDKDHIVSSGKTRAFVARLTQACLPVTHIAIEHVDHAFDVEGNVAFDAQKAAELREIVISFLCRGGRETER